MLQKSEESKIMFNQKNFKRHVVFLTSYHFQVTGKELKTGNKNTKHRHIDKIWNVLK